MSAIQGRAYLWEAMRKDFTAISAFSMAISSVAAVVLCLQIAQIKSAPEWQISGATAWVVEVAIFGTAIYAWRRGISLSGWILGIAGLVLVRLIVATTAAAGLMMAQNLRDFTEALNRTSTLGPRICSSLFALMVFYPLRLLLPLKAVRKADRGRFARSAAAMGSSSAAAAEGDPALLLVGGTETIAVWDTRARPAAAGGADRTSHPVVDLDGTIELPLRALLAQIPSDLWGESVSEYGESHPVPVPLDVILPQLKEARIAVRLGALHDWLPPGTMRSPLESDLEREAALVLLPLELIVPQLPPEALELPPPSPPSWARVHDSDAVLFATI